MVDRGGFRDVPVAILAVAVVLPVSYLVFLSTQSDRLYAASVVLTAGVLTLIRVGIADRPDGASSRPNRLARDLALYCLVVPVGGTVVGVLAVLPAVVLVLSALGWLSIPGLSPFATGVATAGGGAFLTQWIVPLTVLYGALAGAIAVIANGVVR